MWRGLLAAGTLAAGSVVGGVAWADGGRVVLVAPTAPDPVITEALNRIRGELVAEGFDVVVTDSPPPSDSPSAGSPSTQLAAGAQVNGAVAAIGLWVDEGAHVAELRVVDRLTDKVVIRRAPVGDTEPHHAAEVLAVRAVELLRASLLELLLESEHPAGSRPPASAEVRQASAWAAKALPHEREPVWGLEVGAGALADFGGIPAALVAVARIRRAMWGPLAARLTIAGVGIEPRVEGAAGSASIMQDFALAELVGAFATRSIVRFLVSAGAGALYSAVDGRPSSAPYAGHHNWELAFVGDLGMGAELRLARRLGLSFEAHAMVATPYPVVEFLNTDVARAGLPSVLGSISVVGWL
jgi:hypothetical protein